jgi:hypothetical protein
MLRGSVGDSAPRTGGNSSAASTPGRSGNRRHTPSGRRLRRGVGQHGVGEGEGAGPGGIGPVDMVGDRPQPGHASQPGVRPPGIVEFPDPGVRIVPPLADEIDDLPDGAIVVGAQVIMAAGRGVKLQDLTERVELELPAYPFPTTSLPPGYPGRSRVVSSGGRVPSVR